MYNRFLIRKNYLLYIFYALKNPQSVTKDELKVEEVTHLIDRDKTKGKVLHLIYWDPFPVID